MTKPAQVYWPLSREPTVAIARDFIHFTQSKTLSHAGNSAVGLRQLRGKMVTRGSGPVKQGKVGVSLESFEGLIPVVSKS